jgi:hypothetical protein
MLDCAYLDPSGSGGRSSVIRGHAGQAHVLERATDCPGCGLLAQNGTARPDRPSHRTGTF